MRDPRLRVFVSSTLQGLAEERRVARAATLALGLSPVMFEQGARPHPPRSLYRAYLAQGDVFVGIYRRRYGWVAPGEDLSGLEDATPRELHRPLRDDPALLLSERFASVSARHRVPNPSPSARAGPAPAPAAPRSSVASASSGGCSSSCGATACASSPFTGAGGIGKSRLALALAHAVRGTVPALPGHPIRERGVRP